MLCSWISSVWRRWDLLSQIAFRLVLIHWHCLQGVQAETYNRGNLLNSLLILIASSALMLLPQCITTKTKAQWKQKKKRVIGSVASHALSLLCPFAPLFAERSHHCNCHSHNCSDLGTHVLLQKTQNLKGLSPQFNGLLHLWCPLTGSQVAATTMNPSWWWSSSPQPRLGKPGTLLQLHLGRDLSSVPLGTTG